MRFFFHSMGKTGGLHLGLQLGIFKWAGELQIQFGPWNWLLIVVLPIKDY